MKTFGGAPAVATGGAVGVDVGGTVVVGIAVGATVAVMGVGVADGAAYACAGLPISPVEPGHSESAVTQASRH
jgi:hypothetical protein